MDSGSNNYQGLASTSQQNTGSTGQQPQPQSSGGGFAGQVGRALGGGSQPYNPFQPPPQVSRPLTGVPQYGGGTPYTLPPQVSRPPVDVPYTGQGAGPTSQPQTMQERLARASELLGTQGGGMGQPYITDRGYFGPGTMSNPTVPPATQAYQPQNFGQFGFDQQMVDYLNNQRRMSATDAGINYVYDPATQTFKGATMGGPVTKTMDQMRQEAAGYKPGMGGGMGQPYISDRGYFGPGTMSNPTGPQFGQEGVVTSVNRPLTDVPQYGGGMGQPVNFYDADRATGDYRDRMAREMSGGMGQPITTQVSRPPEQLQQEIDRRKREMGFPVGGGPGGNPFSSQQMQQIQQQISQLQQRYMPQAPQQIQQMTQRLQQTPQYQAMMRASQSGDPAAMQRAQRAFESTPQFQQYRAMNDAFNRQQMQASQRMQADPRYQQLQSQINRLQPQVPQGGIGAALARRMGA